MQASAPTTPLRQLRRISLEIAGLALVDDGDAVGAGVGADNAAELEHDQRCMAKRLFAQLDQLVTLGGAGLHVQHRQA